MSLRLNAIADIAPKAKIVADIGCDHGKIAVLLINKGKADRIICTDISGKSLDKARKLAASYGLCDRISFREGNGLSVLKENEADAAIISGMGGELIAKILNENEKKAPDTLILSCNTMAHKLRKWLCDKDYEIEDEELIFEGSRFYPVILAKKSKPAKLSSIELEFGPVMLKKKTDILIKQIDTRIENEIKSRQNIKRFGSPDAKRKLNELDAKIKMYKELKDACKNR